MLFYFTSRIICSISAFLYPGYASYKTLSQRPASEEEIERWLMYWSILGCIVAVEYVAEWAVSWVPFYYFLKTLFLLYLSLPQTQGSSYLYVNHLQPFFHQHESQIDAALASFKVQIYTFLQQRLKLLWDHVASTMAQQQDANFVSTGGQRGAAATAPSTFGESGPSGLIANLWNSYGPGIVAGGTALLRQGAVTAAAASIGAPPPIPPASSKRQNSSQSVLDRRRQLEAELASLPPTDSSIPMPAYQPSRSSSNADLRGRSSSNNMRFEEIDVPSDVEGYDVGESESRGAGKGNSWFGWGSPEAKTKKE